MSKANNINELNVIMKDWARILFNTKQFKFLEINDGSFVE